MKEIEYREGTLDYLIIINGQVLARFDTIIDRNHFLEVLEERYKDCKFIAIDEE